MKWIALLRTIKQNLNADNILTTSPPPAGEGVLIESALPYADYLITDCNSPAL